MSGGLRAACLGGVLFLAACGGGGGGGPSNQPAPVPARAFEDHPEYCGGLEGGECTNWALRAIGAAAAYARIATKEGSSAESVRPGRGVKIAVIDTGLVRDHWEFEGADVELQVLSGTGDTSRHLTSTGRISHGTAVSSAIVANRGPNSRPSQFNFHGLAWGASLKVFAIGLGSGSSTPYVGASISDVELIERGNDQRLGTVLADPAVDIINMSFGYRGLTENYASANIRARLAEEVRIRAQASRNPADRVLLVHAAGNDHGHPCTTGPGCESGALEATSPSLDSGLAVYLPELRTHTVAVVATDRDGEITSFSNRCGVAAEWCIAAPGENVLVAYVAPCTSDSDQVCGDYRTLDGTSFAAPYVSGGLAVLMHYFRGMGNDEILALLYRNADQTGSAAPDPVAAGEQCPEHLDTDDDRSACELSSVFGWGRMDLDAATQPDGITTVALGGTLAGRRLPAASSRLEGGRAFGDALVAGLRDQKAVVFDEWDAPFSVGLDRFVAPAGAPHVRQRLAGFMEPEDELYGHGGSRRVVRPGVAGGIVGMPFADTHLRIGVHRASWEKGGSAWAGGHASLIPFSDGGASATLGKGSWEVSAFATSPAFATSRREPARTAGAMLAWNPGCCPFGFRLGAVREFGSSLGMEASGAFGRLTSGVAFVGAGFRHNAAGWEWAADAELGYADPESSPDLVERVSELSMSAFSVSGTRFLKEGGRVRLSAMQTLRVESGRLQLDVPVARDKQRNVLRKVVGTSLVPSGRQIDLGAEWRSPPDRAGGEVRLGTVLSLEPGHAAGRDPEATAMVGYFLPF